MKSILIGNGINIQFGGKAYTSDFIIKRIKYNALLGKYNELFGEKVQGEDIVTILDGFVTVTNNILDGYYDQYTLNEGGLLESLNDFKGRYEKIRKFNELMLEDWFFVLHMYILAENLNNEKVELVQGFEQLFLDAIYNDGKIQEVHNNIPKKVKKFLKGYDNIFTLNYDNNVEKILGKEIYHLHGDFSILHSSQNEEYVQGFINKSTKNTIVKEGMEHCYCNALLNYSGYKKLEQIKKNYRCIKDSETYKERYDKDLKFESELLATKESNPEIYKFIMAKINHPKLKASTEYYFDELENIEGEIHIIGVSPNNDSHIFDTINQNKKIKKVYFYYHSDYEKNIIINRFSRDLYIPKSVNELWSSLNCNNPKYNIKYSLPNDVDNFITIFNTLSRDEVSKQDILNDAKNIPEYKAISVCKLAKKEIEKRKKEDYVVNEEEFCWQNNTICQVALSEGILPATLYMLWVIYSKKIK